MKKLLGVSIAAMLAVTPMMASAGNTVTTLNNEQGYVNDVFQTNTNIATTSYVQGAYNSLATEINHVADDITVDTANSKNLTNTTIGNNVEELDTAMGNVSTLGTNAPAGSVLADSDNTTDLVTAVKAINEALNTDNGESKVSSGKNYVSQDNTVGENLDALDDAVGQIDSSQGKVKNYVATIGTGDNKKTVAQNIQTLDNVVGQVTTEGSYVKTIGTGANQKTVAKNLEDLDTQVVAAEADITTLKGDVDTSGSVLKSIKDNAKTATFTAANNSSLASLGQNATISDAIEEVNRKADAADNAATVANGTYIRHNNTVAQNLANLDTSVARNATTINSILNTVVPVYGTWGSTTPTQTVTIANISGTANSNTGAPAIGTDAE